MDEVIVVENVIGMDGMRRLHVMGNAPPPAPPQISPKHGEYLERGEISVEAGVYHLRVCEPVRGVVDFHCEGWPKFRRLVVWSLEGCPSVTSALQEAGREFERCFGGRPQFAFVRKLPEAAEYGKVVGDLILLEADWMLVRCVAVGGAPPPTPPQMQRPHLERGEEKER